MPTEQTESIDKEASQPARAFLAIWIATIVGCLLATGCYTSSSKESAKSSGSNTIILPNFDGTAQSADLLRHWNDTNSLLASYDRKLITTILQKWKESVKSYPERTERGTVVVEFLLHDDGHVSEIRVSRSEVHEPLIGFCTS